MKPPIASFAALVLVAQSFVSPAHAESPGEAAAEKLGWHLATKAYTFRAITLYETIDIAHTMGLKYFELNPTQKLSAENPVNTNDTLPPELRAALKAKFAAAGIKVANYGVVKLTADEAADRKIFEFAKDMGIATIVSEPPPEAFDLLDKLTAEYGINVAIHNHPKPSHYWNPQTVLDSIKGHGPRIGACADTGHWPRSGLDPVESIKKLDGHIISLHFKDLNERSAGAHDVIWGTGSSNVKAMLAELHRQGFSGVFSVEYEYNWTSSMPDIEESIKYFKKVAAELGQKVE